MHQLRRTYASRAMEVSKLTLQNNHSPMLGPSLFRHMSYASAVRQTGEQEGLLPSNCATAAGKFPPRLPSIAYGTRIQKSPFFEATTKAGCSDYTVYNHMLMPVAWDGVTPEQEYWALRNDVCLWDVSIQRQIQLKGPDAGALAQFLCARNLSKMKTNQCLYSLMCDKQGLILNDPVICKVADDTYWLSIADADIELWSKAAADFRDYECTVGDAGVSTVAIQGPKSVLIMEELFGEWCRDMGFFKLHNTQAEGTPEVKDPVIAGMPIIIARAGWSPEDGFELLLQDGTFATTLWDKLWEAGIKHNITLGSPNQPRRIETGMLSFRNDIATDMNALEVGLPKKFVNPFMGPNFVGKKALQHIHDNGGPARTLVGLEISGGLFGEPMTSKWDLQTKNGECIGNTGSIAFSYKLEKMIGIGAIGVPYREPGTELKVVSKEGEARDCIVRAFPFEGA